MPSPEEIQQLFDKAFGGRNLVMARPNLPPEPPPELSPEEIQQRLNALFAGFESVHRNGGASPKPSPEPPPKLTPEEIQQQLNEAFAGVLSGGTLRTLPEPRVESPRPPLSPEELQQQLNEAFAASERMKSHRARGLSPRRLRSLFRAGNLATGGRSRRQRCDARVKNLIKIGKNGVRVSRGPFCKTWAMENGRCWMHGGASTGPKSPDGKALVVAAMVEGRRKWVARRRVEGRKFPAGRKKGGGWVTESMRERARAEAHRLNGGRFTLDRPLVLALLRSAAGDPQAVAKAKAMLDAQERAAMERDRQAALARIAELRSSLLANP